MSDITNGVCDLCGDGVLSNGEHIDIERHLRAVIQKVVDYSDADIGSQAAADKLTDQLVEAISADRGIMTDEALPWLGVKLSEIGALRDVWHGDEEKEAWINAPLSVVLDLVAAHDADLTARLAAAAEATIAEAAMYLGRRTEAGLLWDPERAQKVIESYRPVAAHPTAEEFIASMAPADGSIPYAGYGPQYMVDLDAVAAHPEVESKSPCDFCGGEYGHSTSCPNAVCPHAHIDPVPNLLWRCSDCGAVIDNHAAIALLTARVRQANLRRSKKP